MTLAEFATIAARQGWRLPHPVVSVQVTERSGSHRAFQLAFSDGSLQTALVGAGALRLGIDRALGWNRIRSDQY